MTSILLFFQDAGGGSIIWSLLPFVFIFGIFYFLVILPQKKQKQQLQEMITQLKINDEIVTNGGVIGKIKEIKDTSFIIQSAEKSFLEVGKAADLAAFNVAGLDHAGALHDPVAALVFCAPAKARWVMVNGRIVVRDGDLATLDLPVHVERHNRAAAALLAG